MDVNVSHCSGGCVEMGKYETSAELKKAGVISGYDLTTEAALTKLMFLIGEGNREQPLKKLFSKPLRGEMSVE
jgi:L-asparaginase